MKRIDITEVDCLNDRPLYVLIAGAAGVGKSTIINQYIKTIPIMDIDDVIAEIGDGEYNRENVPKASEIISMRIFQIMANKESFIAMGTSSNVSKAVERLTNAREKGYKAILIYVKAPLDQILKQNRIRIENGIRGVKLDEEYKIEEMFEGAEKTVEYLKQSNLLDYLVEYDNKRELS